MSKKYQRFQTAIKGNEIVDVHEVENGLKCGCTCMACGEPLVARQGAINSWYFCHLNNSQCNYGYQTSIHLLAKKIFSELEYIWLPPTNCILGQYTEWTKYKIQKVELEQNKDSVIPDIVVTVDNKPIYVEIFVTHKVDIRKRIKLISNNISTIEINLSKFNKQINEKTLKKVLSSTNEYTYWLYNSAIQDLNNELLKYVTIYDADELPYIFNCPRNIRLNKSKFPYCVTELDCSECPFNLFNNKYFLQVFNEYYKMNMYIANNKKEFKPQEIRNYTTNALKCIDIYTTKKLIGCLGNSNLANAEDINLDPVQRRHKYTFLYNKYIRNLKMMRCPMCGGKLKIKSNSNDGSEFYGCTNWAPNNEGCNYGIDVEDYYNIINNR